MFIFYHACGRLDILVKIVDNWYCWNSFMVDVQNIPSTNSQLTNNEGSMATPKPVMPAMVAAKQVNKKVRTGRKSSWLLVILLLVFLSVGGAGIWWWLNRGEELGVVTVNYWGLWEPQEVMQPLLDQYMAENPGVKINYIESSPEQYRQRLSNQLGREVPEPDIFRFHNSWLPMMARSLSSPPSDVLTVQEFKDRYYPVIRSSLVLNGFIKGIPLQIDGLGLFYNEDIFTSANLSPPRDWVGFKYISSLLTVRDDSGNTQVAGVSLGNASNVTHWPDIFSLLMLQRGVNLAYPNTPVGQEVLSYYRSFSRENIWDWTLPESRLSFATGRVAMYFGKASDVPEIKRLAEENGYNLRFKVVPVPQLPESNVTWASFWSEGVSSKSSPEVQKAAWDLLKYLSEIETMEQLYKLQVADRGYGMPYSRKDMADQISSHPQIGAYVLQAPAAKFWFMASETTDVGGLNFKLNSIYANALNSNDSRVLGKTQEALQEVLREYGII